MYHSSMASSSVNNEKFKEKEKRNPLLIAAAGFVNYNLYGDLGKILTSHIPISGKLAIIDQVEKAKSVYPEVYILVDETAKKLGHILKDRFGVNFILGKAENSLSTSLFQAFDEIDSDGGIDILFGDSFSTDLWDLNLKEKNQIFVSRRTDIKHWKCVQRNNMTSKLTFMNMEKNPNGIYMVTGSFRISNFESFKKLFSKNIHLDSVNDSFWATWSQYDISLKHTVSLTEDRNWQDIGHVDTYFSARRNLISKSARSFNTISMDKSSFKITKTGKPEKIRQELNWYNQIPPQIQSFTPRIFESKSPNSYEIEYESAIPVNEMWISGNNDDSYWNLFIENLSQLLNLMHEMDNKNITVYDRTEYKKQIYLTKLIERIDDFIRESSINEIHQKNLKLNGSFLPKLDYVLENYEIIVNKVAKLDNWSVIHGDLCLSNMIYDRRKNQLKIIDPRGSFFEESIFGDPVYDLIKFSHSVHGAYDFFACNLFSLKQFESNFEIEISESDMSGTAKELCADLLNSQINLRNVSFNEMRMLESGLFLSAAALHLESERGIALYLNGLMIANQVLSQ